MMWSTTMRSPQELASEPGLQRTLERNKGGQPKQQAKRNNNTLRRQRTTDALMEHLTSLEAGDRLSSMSLLTSAAPIITPIEDPSLIPDRLTVEPLCTKARSHKRDNMQPKVVKGHAPVAGDLWRSCFSRCGN